MGSMFLRPAPLQSPFLTLLGFFLWACAAPSRCPVDERVPYDERVFFGFRCPTDCRQHKAGFAWAVRHSARNVATCRSYSGGFAEGCEAYAVERLSAGRAGYRWAEINGVSDACLCSGAGEAFETGCRAYLVAGDPVVPAAKSPWQVHGVISSGHCEQRR